MSIIHPIRLLTAALLLSGSVSINGILHAQPLVRPSEQSSEQPFVRSSEQPSVQTVERAPALRLAVISDVHVQKNYPLFGQKLARALNDLSRIVPGCDALVVNGDLGNGQPEDYRELSGIVGSAEWTPPVYYTIGNHEFYKAWIDGNGLWNPGSFPNGESAEASIRRFLDYTGYRTVYHDAWVQGYHLLFLGSESYRQRYPDSGEDAWLSEEQLEWLEQRLKEGPQDRPVFVFLHQPLPGTVAGSGEAGSSLAAAQYLRLKTILSRCPQAILFTGHSHRELGVPATVIRDRFTMVNTSSVAQPYNSEDQPYPPEADRSEGLVVEAKGGEVRIRGRDFAAGQWIGKAQYVIRRMKGNWEISAIESD